MIEFRYDRDPYVGACKQCGEKRADRRGLAFRGLSGTYFAKSFLCNSPACRDAWETRVALEYAVKTAS